MRKCDRRKKKTMEKEIMKGRMLKRKKGIKLREKNKKVKY